MRSYEDIQNMANADYSIGLEAHYKPLANLINERGYVSGIEIGTAYAGNAWHLLQNTKLETLACVDPYKYYPAMPGFICQEEYDTLYKFAYNRIGWHPACVMFKMSSQDFFDNELNKSADFDFVFLDGSHEYEDVKWECENYSKIIKPGGVLCGHDYDIFEGVNKAVNEFSLAAGKNVYTLPGNIWYINY